MNSTANPVLTSTVKHIEICLSKQVSKVTMNKAHDAHNDLDDLVSLLGKCRGWLDDISIDSLTEDEQDTHEDACNAIDEMKEAAEEAQREMLDREYHEDDTEERVVMEYMEEQVSGLDTAVEDFGRLAA